MATRQILLVDNDPLFLKQLQKLLAPYKIAVNAADPDSCDINTIKSSGTNAVIIAVDSPDKKGFSICTEIRQSLHSQVPVALVTATLSDRVMRLHQKHKFHADAYFNKKGLTAGALIHQLRKMLPLKTPAGSAANGDEGSELLENKGDRTLLHYGPSAGGKAGSISDLSRLLSERDAQLEELKLQLEDAMLAAKSTPFSREFLSLREELARKNEQISEFVESQQESDKREEASEKKIRELGDTLTGVRKELENTLKLKEKNQYETRILRTEAGKTRAEFEDLRRKTADNETKMAETAALERKKFQQECGALQEKLARQEKEAVARLKEVEDRHAFMLDTINREHEAALRVLEKQHGNAIGVLKAQHETEIREIQSTLEADSGKREDDYKKRLVAAQEQFAKEKTAIYIGARAELEAKINALIKELEAERSVRESESEAWNSEKKKLARELAYERQTSEKARQVAEEAAAGSTNETARKVLETENRYKRQIDSLKRDCEAAQEKADELEGAREELESRVESLQLEYKADLSERKRKYEQRCAELEAVHRSELERVSNTGAEKIIAEKLALECQAHAKTRQSLENRIALLENDAARREKELAVLRRQSEQMKESPRAEKAGRYRQQIEDLKQELAETGKELESALESIKKEEARNQSAGGKKSRAGDLEIKKLTGDLNKAREKLLEAEKANEAEKMKAEELRKRLTAVDQKHQIEDAKRVSEWEKHYKGALNGLVEKYNARIKELESELERAEKKHAEDLKLSEAKTLGAWQRAEDTSKEFTDIQNALRADVQKIEHDYRQKLADLNERHKAEIENLRIENEKAVQANKAYLASAMDEIARLKVERKQFEDALYQTRTIMPDVGSTDGLVSGDDVVDKLDNFFG